MNAEEAALAQLLTHYRPDQLARMIVELRLQNAHLRQQLASSHSYRDKFIEASAKNVELRQQLHNQITTRPQGGTN